MSLPLPLFGTQTLGDDSPPEPVSVKLKPQHSKTCECRLVLPSAVQSRFFRFFCNKTLKAKGPWLEAGSS